MESTDQFGRTNFRTRLPEPLLLAGYRRILETVYEPRRYLARVRAMMHLRPPLVSRHRRYEARRLLAAARALVTQGLLGSYRRAYWAFLSDVWRWDRSRIAEALLRAAAGHHFLEYTRRDAIPRLSEPLPEERAGAGASTAKSVVAMHRNPNASPAHP